METVVSSEETNASSRLSTKSNTVQTTKEGLSDINTLNIKPQHQVKSVLKHGYRVRANACSHTATTLATTAVTTMNKTIQAKSESMGAKHVFNS